MENPFYINAPSNNSMDVRAKQRLSYHVAWLIQNGLGGGFASRQFRRSAFHDAIDISCG